MTLAELLAEPLPAYDDLRKLWIVIAQNMYDLLMQLQPKYLHQRRLCVLRGFAHRKRCSIQAHL
jgi:hypothetical protein